MPVLFLDRTSRALPDCCREPRDSCGRHAVFALLQCPRQVSGNSQHQTMASVAKDACRQSEIINLRSMSHSICLNVSLDLTCNQGLWSHLGQHQRPKLQLPLSPHLYRRGFCWRLDSIGTTRSALLVCMWPCGLYRCIGSDICWPGC